MLALATLLAIGCWRGQGLGNDAPSDDDASTDADTDADSDADSDVDSDTDTCNAGTYTGSLKAYSDEEIAALAGYTEIDGYLWIGNHYWPEEGMTEVTSLAPLACLQRVGGDMRLMTISTLSLDGLHNLTEVDGDLELASVGDGWPWAPEIYGPSGLERLESLERVGGNLEITENTFDSLDGLQNLETIEGGIFVTGQSALKSLEGLSGLTSLGMSEPEYYDPMLSSEGVSIRLSDSSLESLHGLEGIVSIPGDLIVSPNTEELHDLTGLDNLISIEGNLCIKWGDLSRLQGLEALESVGGVLFIESNDYLLDLDGLSSLASVEKDLYIGLNTQLESLAGLADLTAVGGDLRIASNEQLLDLDGLFNLTSLGGDISIEHNDSLPQCYVDQLVEKLTDLGWSGAVHSEGNDADGQCE